MSNRIGKLFLFYTPRLLSIALVVVLSVFAFEAYQGAEGESVSNSPFIVYLFPVFILLVITAISWRKARIGGTLFIMGGLFYAFAMDEFPTSSLTMVATPLILLGVLFHISQYFRK